MDPIFWVASATAEHDVGGAARLGRRSSKHSMGSYAHRLRSICGIALVASSTGAPWTGNTSAPVPVISSSAAEIRGLTG